MYKDRYSEELIRKLKKIKKKDLAHFKQILNKIDSIVNNPEHRYKTLRHNKKGLKRVHLGHFVLVFHIDESKEIISFEDYNHHDTIYL